MNSEIEHCRHYDAEKHKRKLTCPYPPGLFNKGKPRNRCTDRYAVEENYKDTCEYYED